MTTNPVGPKSFERQPTSSLTSSLQKLRSFLHGAITIRRDTGYFRNPDKMINTIRLLGEINNQEERLATALPLHEALVVPLETGTDRKVIAAAAKALVAWGDANALERVIVQETRRQLPFEEQNIGLYELEVALCEAEKPISTGAPIPPLKSYFPILRALLLERDEKVRGFAQRVARRHNGPALDLLLNILKTEKDLPKQVADEIRRTIATIRSNLR
jgi:hypothetical protein